MPNAFKNFIRALIPEKAKEFVAFREEDRYMAKVYSQEGEDLLVRRIFDQIPSGFYIDIGAHHPFRFSNTKLLYDKGWTGINIEPNPDVVQLFQQHRPRDINLCTGVSSNEQVLTYYKFSHPALNTFDEKMLAERAEKPISSEPIPTQSLKSILDIHLKKDQKINFLTVDAEGLDFEILKSNDWTKYRPDWICAELPTLDLKGALEHPISKLLEENGYTLFSKLWKSCLYQKVPNAEP